VAEPLTMSWHVSGPGSARWRWEVAGEVVAVHASYLGDALRELLRSAVDLKLGSSATFAHFMGEPGGTRVFFSGAAEEVFVQVVWFEDLISPEEWWKGGTLRWAGRVPTRAFIEAVRAMAEHVLAEHGEAGYQRAWGFPFPAEELKWLSGDG
jgi:hypothetical protein